MFLQPLALTQTALESCASSAKALDTLRTDEADSNTDGASASPTLIVNGVEFNGARTPDNYKTAICNSFDVKPAECATVLPSLAQSAASSGGCA